MKKDGNTEADTPYLLDAGLRGKGGQSGALFVEKEASACLSFQVHNSFPWYMLKVRILCEIADGTFVKTHLS